MERKIDNIDFFKLSGIALSRLGIMPDQLMELAPVELSVALDDVYKLEESRYKARYNVARWTVKHIINIAGRSLPKGKSLKRDYEVEHFEWDKDTAFKPKQSLKEMKAALLGIAYYFKGKKKEG